MRRFSFSARVLRQYHGSAMLSSCTQRVARVLPAVLFMWVMTSWAMGWW